MDCPFCKIDNERTRILEETSYCLVIFSNPRLMPGHLLIVPKRHLEKISKLNKTEREDIFNLLIKYQELILKHIASGCDIRQNYRPFQKQTNLKVHHLHFHLQPREFKDELYQRSQVHETAMFDELDPKELSYLKKIFAKQA